MLDDVTTPPIRAEHKSSRRSGSEDMSCCFPPKPFASQNGNRQVTDDGGFDISLVWSNCEFRSRTTIRFCTCVWTRMTCAHTTRFVFGHNKFHPVCVVSDTNCRQPSLSLLVLDRNWAVSNELTECQPFEMTKTRLAPKPFVAFSVRNDFR